MAQALLERARRREGLGSWQDSCLLWTMCHRNELRPEVPFDLQHHGYLQELYTTRAQEVVVFKASQMGASEYAISYALHAADVRHANVLYIFPTDTHVSDFSTARLGLAIEASPYLGSIVGEGSATPADGRRQRGADRITLKRVRNSYLYFRGAQVKPNGQAPQLKSIDADILIYDEVDEMDPRAPAIAEKRLGHSTIAEQRWISTPTYPGFGIHARWLESDQREWHVRCDGCGEWQPLTLAQIVNEFDKLGRPASWNGMSEGRAWIACRKCKREINNLGPGQWVPAYPDRDIAGYHLTKLFGPTTDLLAIVKALDTVDETERREAYNQDLGEPYVPRGDRLTADKLDAVRRDYAHGAVSGEKPAMGVDVGRVLHVVIRGVDKETGERPQRWAGAVDGWNGLHLLALMYDVGAIVVDALPETTKAREFQEKFPRGRVWLAYYVAQRTGTKCASAIQWDDAQYVVNLDRTRVIDGLVADFHTGERTLPQNARDIPEYYGHLTSITRVLEDGPHGEKVARWVESAPDHLAHAESYCRIASEAPSNWFELGFA